MNYKAPILTVDDTPADLKLLVDILTPAGYLVRPADSGELALAAVDANPPDLILLDVHLQGMDGLEVCRRLKAREKTRHIPIIMVSSSTDVKEWVAGLQLGASDYIAKPLHAEELLTRVKTHLTLSRMNVVLAKQECAIRQTNEQLQTQVVELQRVEAALRASDEKSRMLFHEMLNGFALHEIICDETGNPSDYRFLAVNPAFERMTNLKAEDILGRTVLEVLPDIERTCISLYGKVALTGEPAVFDQLFTSIGKHFEVTAFRPALNQFACFFDDITVRKLAEAQLAKQLDELRRWQTVTLGREGRVCELKREVNALSARLGQPPPYATPGNIDLKENR